ncbi:MAG: hypothetical protein U0793_15180 [Gemmataceae bacterium]
MTPGDDGPGNEDRGLLWMNLIGLSLVFLLLAAFFILYGPKLWDFLSWLFGNDGGAEQWMKR